MNLCLAIFIALITGIVAVVFKNNTTAHTYLW